jgi:hypothetical protein
VVFITPLSQNLIGTLIQHRAEDLFWWLIPSASRTGDIR